MANRPVRLGTSECTSGPVDAGRTRDSRNVVDLFGQPLGADHYLCARIGRLELVCRASCQEDCTRQ